MTFSTFKPDVICSVVPKFSDIRLGRRIVMGGFATIEAAEVYLIDMYVYTL